MESKKGGGGQQPKINPAPKRATNANYADIVRGMVRGENTHKPPIERKQSSQENIFFITGREGNTTNGGISAKSKESNLLGVGITQTEFLHLIQDLED